MSSRDTEGSGPIGGRASEARSAVWLRLGRLLALGVVVFIAGRVIGLIRHATHEEFETAARQETWWAGVLRRQGMPRSEIRAVLAAADPAIVRRHLELHRERLEERVAEEKGELSCLEKMLTGRPPASVERSDVRAATSFSSSRR